MYVVIVGLFLGAQSFCLGLYYYIIYDSFILSVSFFFFLLLRNGLYAPPRQIRTLDNITLILNFTATLQLQILHALCRLKLH